jgi:hypothetical protein
MAKSVTPRQTGNRKIASLKEDSSIALSITTKAKIFYGPKKIVVRVAGLDPEKCECLACAQPPCFRKCAATIEGCSTIRFSSEQTTRRINCAMLQASGVALPVPSPNAK